MFLIEFFLDSQEKIPIEEVFQQLKCTREGLTTQEGEDRIQIFGFNKLEEKKVLSLTKPCCILVLNLVVNIWELTEVDLSLKLNRRAKF